MSYRDFPPEGDSPETNFSAKSSISGGSWKLIFQRRKLRLLLGAGTAFSLLAALVLITVVGGYARPQPVSEAAAEAKPEVVSDTAAGEGAALKINENSAEITVHVAGEVAQPGVYRIPAQSRGQDAVAAAGGLKASARQDLVNLAEKLKDGDQLVVPGSGLGNAPGTGNPQAPQLVNLNQAGSEELQKISGIGPATAQRIIAWRNRKGSFKTVADLRRVEGIGPKLFGKIKDMLTV